MNGKTKWLLILALAAGTSLAATLPATAPDAAPPAANTTTLDDLLNSLGIPFNTTGEGWYRLTFPDAEGSNINMMFNVRHIGTLTDGTNVSAAILYVPLVRTPEDYTPSPAILKKIAELNAKLDMGRIVHIGAGKGYYFLSPFWLNDATTKTLYFHILYASANTGDMVDILRPFVNN